MATKTKPAPSPPAAAPTVATPGIKKLNFGGIATGKPAVAVGTADKPVLPDPDGHISELAASIKEKTAQEVSIQTKEFHEKRHREFDVAQNIELDRVCPMIVQIQTKGRAAKD